MVSPGAAVAHRTPPQYRTVMVPQTVMVAPRASQYERIPPQYATRERVEMVSPGYSYYAPVRRAARPAATEPTQRTNNFVRRSSRGAVFFCAPANEARKWTRIQPGLATSDALGGVASVRGLLRGGVCRRPTCCEARRTG